MLSNKLATQVDRFKVGGNVYYRENREGMQLSAGQQVSAVAGVHCSAAVVNPQTTHGLELLPEGVHDDAASLFVMPAVGLNGVDTANPRMGDGRCGLRRWTGRIGGYGCVQPPGLHRRCH